MNKLPVIDISAKAFQLSKRLKITSGFEIRRLRDWEIDNLLISQSLNLFHLRK